MWLLAAPLQTTVEASGLLLLAGGRVPAAQLALAGEAAWPARHDPDAMETRSKPQLAVSVPEIDPDHTAVSRFSKNGQVPITQPPQIYTNQQL